MVKPQPSKLMMRVRFPSPAPYINIVYNAVFRFLDKRSIAFFNVIRIYKFRLRELSSSSTSWLICPRLNKALALFLCLGNGKILTKWRNASTRPRRQCKCTHCDSEFGRVFAPAFWSSYFWVVGKV